MLNLKGESKKRKKNKNKNKNNNDDVEEVAVGVSQGDFTTGGGNTTSMMLDKPAKGKKLKDGKKKKRKDKNKGKQDDVEGMTMVQDKQGITPDEEFQVPDDPNRAGLPS